MTSHTLFVVLFLWMQYICTVGTFDGGVLEGFDDNFGGIPVEPTPQPEEEIKKQDLVGDPKNRVISAEALKNMGSSEYSDVIAQVVETAGGPQRFKVDPNYIPDNKFEHDRHLISYSNDKRDLLDSLPEVSPENGPGETGYRVKRASFSEGYSRTWPSGVIPYTAANMTDVKFKVWIDAAVAMFEKKTCVRWVPYTNQPHHVEFLGKEKAICAAYLGMRSQEISPLYLYEIGNNCRAYYVVVHEMMHVMGADHEQSREDRYNNIHVDWNCISKGARQNYMLSLSADEDSEYDLASMMQYNPNLFRECVTEGLYGNKTMSAKNLRLDFLLYELVHQLTHYDIKSITEAYHCNEGCTDNCQNGGFVTKTVENPHCHCVCPKHFFGDQCTERQNEGECGSHTILQKYQPKIVKSNGYDQGFYELDRECIYQFTSPPGTRIKLEFVDMEITVSDAEITTCVHFIEVIVNLMGQAGPEECGVSTNLTYFTSINSESNMAMLNLNTLRAGSPSRGFMLKATAIESECLDHPCQNGGTCSDVESTDGTYHFECDCLTGYSGDRCDYVTAEDCLLE
ncbi:Blastula protease 10 [Mizuhopecten yessoensis]|uniref:Metalloendopeptidase n=1 Tax=Mizuhopecten yessoensis TaxID=6573 RepID=A0A210QMW1_MIZYE|nr:Blastula protease 10 [Mizuhopecten yessoensis]